MANLYDKNFREIMAVDVGESENVRYRVTNHLRELGANA